MKFGILYAVEQFRNAPGKETREELLHSFNECAKKDGVEAAIIEIINKISKKWENTLAFLQFCEEELYKGLKEAGVANKELVKLALEQSQSIHSELIKSSKKEKINLLHKRMTRLFMALGEANLEKIQKFILMNIEKQDKTSYSSLSWAVSSAYSLIKIHPSIKPFETKVKESFLKRVERDLFSEKPTVTGDISSMFMRDVFNLIESDSFENIFRPEFAKRYMKNSTNIGLVYNCLSCFPITYLNKIKESALLELYQPKLSETLVHKSPDIVEASLNTFQLLLKIKNQKLRELVLSELLKKIKTSKLEAHMMKYCRIFGMLKLNEFSVETQKTAVSEFVKAFAQIKNKDFLVSMIPYIDTNVKKIAKHFGSLQDAEPLIADDQCDEAEFCKYYILDHILEVRKEEPGAKELAERACKLIIEKSVIAILITSRAKLVSLYSKAITGLHFVLSSVERFGLEGFEEPLTRIAKALTDNNIYLYKPIFKEKADPIVFTLLIVCLIRLCAYIKDLEAPSFDIYLTDLILSPEIKLKIFKNYGLNIWAAIRIGKGICALRYLTENIKTHYDYIILNAATLVPTTQLNVQDSFALVSFISFADSSKFTLEFIRELIEGNKTHNISSLLSFPSDMEQPLRHYWFGTKGLFSRGMDDKKYFSNYCAVLLAIKPETFFEEYMSFYRADDLATKEGIYSHTVHLELKSLEDQRAYLEPYKQCLRAADRYHPAPTKDKDKKKGKAPQTTELRSIEVEDREIGEFELELVNTKENEANFSHYLNRLTSAIAIYFEVALGSSTEIKKTILDQIHKGELFANAKRIVEQSHVLGEGVKELVVVFLSSLIKGMLPEEYSLKFSKLNYEIMRSGKASTSEIEHALDHIFEARNNERLHPAGCPVIVDFALFAFENLYDGEGRRKSFDVLLAMTGRGSTLTTEKIFFFIKENLDNLRYVEVKSLLNNLINELKTRNNNYVNHLLLNLLNYESKAVATIVEALLEMQEDVLNTQKIDQFAKIKLSILEKGEHKENAELAKSLLSKLGGPLNYEQIMSLDFGRFVTEVPFDLHELTANILNEYLIHLSLTEKENLFDKILTELRKQVDTVVEQIQEDPEEVMVDEVEENLAVYPIILRSLIPNCPPNKVEAVFDTIMQIECYELPILSDASCDVGLKYIDAFKGDVSKFANFFSENLDKRDMMIAPIVFIAGCSKYLEAKKIKTQFGDFAAKILSLSVQDDIQFQRKLGQNIPKLMSFFSNPKDLVKDLLDKTYRETSAIRIRGQCYIICGLIRGIGIKQLTEAKIIDMIVEFISSSKKKDLKDLAIGKRYFVVYIISALYELFGRIFEPKFCIVLPYLMKLFGDSESEIRDLSTAVLNTSMSKLSGYGVKTILPSLLEGCASDNWRTKLSNLSALGSMAHLASKQLAACLPEIVPKLTSATGDTNSQIQEAAIKSLGLILSTIKSPEIIAIKDALIKALSNPFEENGRALDALMNTEFLHLLDTPSFALIIPVTLYGLQNKRSSAEREKAAKVVANIAGLVKGTDEFEPYIERLTDAMKLALSDILPETRATVAKAAGRLMARLGAIKGEKMLKGFRQTLDDQFTTSVERSGCAQALCECLAALGMQQIEANWAHVIDAAQDKRDYIRESFLNMVVFMPLILDMDYERYLSATLKSTLNSIDHTVENIRSLAVRSIKIIIQKFSDKNSDIILAALFEGMFSENHLKRNSCVILLGDTIDVLFKQNLSKEEIYRKNPQLFSALYVVKHDESPDVKLATTTVWSNFVANTMKCLKHIYPVLVDMYITLFASSAPYHSEIAEISLNAFAEKYGDVFLTEILGHLKEKVKMDNQKTNEGVCILLSQFIENAKPDHLRKSRRAIIEELLTYMMNSSSKSVWVAALNTFKVYYSHFGEIEFMKAVITDYTNQMTSNEEDTEEFEKNMAIVSTILNFDIGKLVRYIEKIIFSGELSIWKLELIANSSKIFAQRFYLKGYLNEGFDFFMQPLETNIENKEYCDMVVYTVKEIVSNLTEEAESNLVRQCIEYIKKYTYQPATSFYFLDIALQSMTNFYEESDINSSQFLNVIFEITVPLLTRDDEKAQDSFELLARLYEVLFNPLTSDECAEKIENIDYAFRAKVKPEDVLHGLRYRPIFTSIFNVISRGIVVGDARTCSAGVETLVSLTEKISEEILLEWKTKFLGIFIRLGNYQYDSEIKSEIANAICKILPLGPTSRTVVGQLACVAITVFNSIPEEAQDHEIEHLVEVEKLVEMIDQISGKRLFVLKKWAKRVVADEKYKIGHLLKYAKNREEYKSYVSEIQSLIHHKDLEGINKL